MRLIITFIFTKIKSILNKIVYRPFLNRQYLHTINIVKVTTEWFKLMPITYCNRNIVGIFFINY